MFSLLGAAGVVEGLRELLHRRGFEADGDDASALKFVYNRWLATFQSPATISSSEAPQFVLDPDVERELLEAFREPPHYDQQLPPIDDRAIDEAMAARDPMAVQACLDRVGVAHHTLSSSAPDWALAFDLAINRVFTARLAGTLAGSSPKAIGVIWLAPPADTANEDLVEALVHELAHHLSFLDAVSAPALRVSAAAVRVPSVIRGVPRPLGAAFDSLIVAVDVMRLRERAGWHGRQPRLHPASAVLWEASRASCRQLLSRCHRNFTPRGLTRLEQMREQLEAA